MIKQMAWNTFKNTGNIDTFLEFKHVRDIESNFKVENDELIQDEWDNNSGEDDLGF